MICKDSRVNRRHNTKRGQSGTIGLVVSFLAVIVILGLSVCDLIGILGGACQLQDAADSAALNVGKQQITFELPLAPGLEQQNFSCVAENGQVNLLNYNRIIGQLLLISKNAEAEQAAGSSAALSHANQLWYAVQGADASLGQRLSARLKDSSSATTAFSSVIGHSNLRMLPVYGAQYRHDKYNVAYLNAGDSTNVYLDEGLIPDGANITPDCLSNPKGKEGHKFIKGYTGISIGSTFTIQGTPVMPGLAPHLVSNLTFAAHTQSPVKIGFAPPNCFQAACSVNLQGSGLARNACAVVGSLKGEYAASIPGGYIEMANGGASSGTIMELLCKGGLNAQDFLVPQVVQRIRQIQPDMSEQAVVEWLDGVELPSGKKAFLCLDPQSKQMHAVLTAPANYVDGTMPDGKEQTFGNADVTTLTFTPSCGYDNLLGVIKLNDNLEHFAAEQKQILAEAKQQVTAEKDRMNEQKASLRAAVDRAKAAAALQTAKADENSMKEDLKNAQTQEQDAKKASESAQKDEKDAKEALAQAQADLKEARTDKKKAAILEREAAAEKRLAEADKRAAEKEKALSEADKERAEKDQRLAKLEDHRAETERQKATKDQELARIATQRACKDQQSSRPLFQQSPRDQQLAQSVVRPSLTEPQLLRPALQGPDPGQHFVPTVSRPCEPTSIALKPSNLTTRPSNGIQASAPAPDSGGSQQQAMTMSHEPDQNSQDESSTPSTQSIVRNYNWN